MKQLIDSLDALLGWHPAALRDLYGRGMAADPEGLAGRRRGRLLAFEPLAATHLATRPLVVALAKHLLPWRGKAFDPDGTGGRNRMLGRSILPFRCDRGPSEVDGKPTLFLRYDGVGNPWPVSRIVDELRTVGDVAIGPASFRTVRGSLLLAWWGLELP